LHKKNRHKKLVLIYKVSKAYVIVELGLSFHRELQSKKIASTNTKYTTSYACVILKGATVQLGLVENTIAKVLFSCQHKLRRHAYLIRKSNFEEGPVEVINVKYISRCVFHRFGIPSIGVFWPPLTRLEPPLKIL